MQLPLQHLHMHHFRRQSLHSQQLHFLQRPQQQYLLVVGMVQKQS